MTKAHSREKNDRKKTKKKKNKQCKTAIPDPSLARINLTVEKLT